jgi:hypothetical protein
MIAQAHKKDDRAMQIDVVLPAKVNKIFSLIYILCSYGSKPAKEGGGDLLTAYHSMYSSCI